MRSCVVSCLKGAFDPDQMPEEVTKAIMNAALSRASPCCARVLYALAERSVTRVVGNDDFALRCSPGAPGREVPGAAVTSMAVRCAWLSLGGAAAHLPPEPFKALALVGEADASDRVLPWRVSPC